VNAKPDPKSLWRKPEVPFVRPPTRAHLSLTREAL
jgi:hypothetical protein